MARTALNCMALSLQVPSFVVLCLAGAVQEMVRFNKLLAVMGTSLVDLQRAIRGEILLSDELDKCVPPTVVFIHLPASVSHRHLACSLLAGMQCWPLNPCPAHVLVWLPLACPYLRMYTCLLNNQVPKNWEAAAYPSLKPLASWVKDFHARIVFMRDWLQHGQPSVFWMSGFFFPQVCIRVGSST